MAKSAPAQKQADSGEVELNVQKVSEPETKSDAGQYTLVAFHPNYKEGEKIFAEMAKRNLTFSAEGAKLVIKG